MSAGATGQSEAAERRQHAERARRARRMVGGGALLLLAGLAMVGVGPSDGGTGVTVLALAMLIYGIHTFGRLGPDEHAGAP